MSMSPMCKSIVGCSMGELVVLRVLEIEKSLRLVHASAEEVHVFLPKVAGDLVFG